MENTWSILQNASMIFSTIVYDCQFIFSLLTHNFRTICCPSLCENHSLSHLWNTIYSISLLQHLVLRDLLAESFVKLSHSRGEDTGIEHSQSQSPTLLHTHTHINNGTFTSRQTNIILLTNRTNRYTSRKHKHNAFNTL